MVLLDTNVISEILKPQPAGSVLGWLSTFARSQVFTTSVTQAEILYGVALLPPGQKRNRLLKAVHEVFSEVLGERILAFDTTCAPAYAEIAANRRSLGRPISQLDAQIGAIALTHGLRLATRNTCDFEECGILLVNPWELS